MATKKKTRKKQLDTTLIALGRLVKKVYDREGWERSEVREDKMGFWVLSAFSDFECETMITVQHGDRAVARRMLRAALEAAE